MRIILQRVSSASVIIEHSTYAKIDKGYLILLGIEEADSPEDIEWLSKKIVNLRLFPDEQDQMNLSINEIKGDALIVSQFTLFAKTKKGNRPSFVRAAKPDIAIPLYEKFVETISPLINGKVCTGQFGGSMQIALVNDGPVTISIDSKARE